MPGSEEFRALVVDDVVEEGAGAQADPAGVEADAHFGQILVVLPNLRGGMEDIPHAASVLDPHTLRDLGRLHVIPLLHLHDHGGGPTGMVLSGDHGVQALGTQGQLVFEEKPVVVEAAQADGSAQGAKGVPPRSEFGARRLKGEAGYKGLPQVFCDPVLGSLLEEVGRGAVLEFGRGGGC